MTSDQKFLAGDLVRLAGEEHSPVAHVMRDEPGPGGTLVECGARYIADIERLVDADSYDYRCPTCVRAARTAGIPLRVDGHELAGLGGWGVARGTTTAHLIYDISKNYYRSECNRTMYTDVRVASRSDKQCGSCARIQNSIAYRDRQKGSN